MWRVSNGRVGTVWAHTERTRKNEADVSSTLSDTSSCAHSGPIPVDLKRVVGHTWNFVTRRRLALVPGLRVVIRQWWIHS
jgi:hypothetical protein